MGFAAMGDGGWELPWDVASGFLEGLPASRACGPSRVRTSVVPRTALGAHPAPGCVGRPFSKDIRFRCPDLEGLRELRSEAVPTRSGPSLPTGSGCRESVLGPRVPAPRGSPCPPLPPPVLRAETLHLTALPGCL